MFMIHSPQTITLHADDGDDMEAVVNFNVDGADTSRCVLEIVSKGRTWTATFNTRGYLIDQSYKAPNDNPDEPVVELTPSDYIVGGRDTRADNPYTFQPALTEEQRVRGAVGHSAPIPYGSDGKPVVDEKEHRRKAMDDAADNARKQREEDDRRARETPEERSRRLAEEQDKRHDLARKQLERSEQDSKGGVRLAGEPERNPDGSLRPLMAPAPSSPLPGSPPPHPLDQPNHGVVNTTQSMAQSGSAPLAHSGDLKTADDTTAADVAWDAPHEPPAVSQPIRQYPRDYDPLLQAAATDAAKPSPIGLKPADTEIQHG